MLSLRKIGSALFLPLLIGTFCLSFLISEYLSLELLIPLVIFYVLFLTVYCFFKFNSAYIYSKSSFIPLFKINFLIVYFVYSFIFMGVFFVLLSEIFDYIAPSFLNDMSGRGWLIFLSTLISSLVFLLVFGLIDRLFSEPDSGKYQKKEGI
ncbi:hypothetical protein MsAc7_12830 [Methanolapillus millepedarum]|uniref:Uncharacterized protein n=1 Tax=Methanolapillus millepedarum TaxID=3028296 RepID=A0AA96V537_9EURY|nr:hypothetical protein MsAc7_12830 [Methanosarcinaceae archaeon Ac7]